MLSWLKNRRGVRSTPTLLQMEDVECGAVSLGIILAYYRCYIPIETLREDCGVSRDGISAVNILKAAQKYGLEAKGYKKKPESLRHLQPPFIVHWNFNHFLVVNGFKGDSVYLNDPAQGQTTVSLQEFDESFTGVVLTLAPGETFTPQGEPFSIRRALLQRLSNRIDWFYLVLTGVGLAALGLFIPVFLKIFIDQMMTQENFKWLTALLFSMGAVLVLQSILTGLREHILLRLETKLSLQMSGRFLWHILRLPMKFFDHRYAGDLSARIQSNDRVAQFITGRLASTVIDALLVGLYLIFMTVYNGGLALAATGIAALNIVYFLWVQRVYRDRNQKLQADYGKLEGATIAGITSLESLKANGREDEFFARWAGYQANKVKAEQQMKVSNQYLAAIPMFLKNINQALILLIGGLLIIQGEFTVGMLVAFQGFATGFLGPVNRLVAMGGEFQEMKGHLSRLDDVLRHPLDTVFQEPQTNRGSRIDRPKLTGALDIQRVTFGYNPLDDPLLHDIRLRIPPGSFTAIVGGSGSGKSTLAKLLTGVYQPWEGEILFDGKPREQHAQGVFAQSLAFVDQDIRLFSGTLYENISLWDETIPRSVVIQAAKDSCIHQEISSRTGGYDHELIEGGRNFSGGQAQRLEIARSLAMDPSILVLDEATSALDPEIEVEVYANLRRRGCTCVIIAHRLSAIRDCDQIVVVDQGKVVQQGTHDELIEREGPYAKLYEANDTKEEVS